jgi:hypothetical protein
MLKKNIITSSNKGCDNYSWDPVSAIKKGISDTTICLNLGAVNVVKTIGSNDPKKDAFRNCSNCGSHYNYHKKIDFFIL